MPEDHSWRQLNIAFPDWTAAEATAATYLAPLLDRAESHGQISHWFFIRKRPAWRLRYLPHSDSPPDSLPAQLDELKDHGLVTGTTAVVYDPEVHAFGGDAGMTSSTSTASTPCPPSPGRPTKTTEESSPS